MKHPVDVVAIATYVAGGGIAGVFAFLGTLYPVHQAQFNSAAIALVAIAGVIRVMFNATPTTTATVRDKATATDVVIPVPAQPEKETP
ncbi:MAG: hypothetical protein NVS3B7_19380 [Candidatus Elarobacter sp.]